MKFSENFFSWRDLILFLRSNPQPALDVSGSGSGVLDF